jgi:hypothetical protein
LFINYAKTVEELIELFYNSIQDYFDYRVLKCLYNNPNPMPACFYYSCSDDDSDPGDEDFVDQIQEDRYQFFSKYNDKFDFDKYYSE